MEGTSSLCCFLTASKSSAKRFRLVETFPGGVLVVLVVAMVVRNEAEIASLREYQVLSLTDAREENEEMIFFGDMSEVVRVVHPP